MIATTFFYSKYKVFGYILVQTTFTAQKIKKQILFGSHAKFISSHFTLLLAIVSVPFEQPQ